jgi:hypothetical protein
MGSTDQVVKPGKDGDLNKIYEELLNLERKNPTGLVRSFTLRNQNDPAELYGLVILESEDQARARERDPETHAVVMRLQDVMDGPPEFVDFSVVSEFSL